MVRTGGRPKPGEDGFRSWVMSRVRSQDTRPELTVRRLLHAMGYRYRLRLRTLPGSPDLAFTGRRKVVWVHGCFWHGHTCPNGTRLPRTNVAFWEEKRRRNQERDLLAERNLVALGWEFMVVWECELKQPEAVGHRLVEFLGPPSARLPGGPV
ncbi:very short patch repair endonuclease [Geothrix sp. 21YS21S-2]|uniref:very short patch repair endonuclease n=1 Tax=Geothrix sp. 21YS21S-2 TaxID=3068893 RepID=UPI00358EC412